MLTESRIFLVIIFLGGKKKSHLVDNLFSTLSYCGFSVFKGLDCVVCLFHVERLLHEVISLALIPGRYNNEIKLDFHSS